MAPTLILAEKLNRTTFAPFGGVVDNLSGAGHGDGYPKCVSANQGTAIKYPDITPLKHLYHTATSSPASSVVSLFRCSPRFTQTDDNKRVTILCDILERHPYTTQMFVPMGLESGDESTCFVVIVAPDYNGSPDLDNLRAFISNGAQAVSYGIGTWHAPMIVVGKKGIDFVVTQFCNGVAADDCEEITISPITIALTGLARTKL